jgi:sensor histidine kinase YesM
MLEISNTYEGERIKKGENEYISTKDNKRMHGIGLITVKNIVKKYRGSVDICDEGNIFDVVVYIRENNI